MPEPASVDENIALADLHGLWHRFVIIRNNVATEAGDAAGGALSAQRFPVAVAVPSVGAGLAGMYLTMLRLYGTASNVSLIAALEYNLGSVNVADNVFTDGVVMPTKIVRGAAVQTAAALAFVVVTAAVTGNPVLTITYTDQDGNTGQSAAVTPGTAPALNSAFPIHPQLASGDTGIRDVTGLSRAGGTVGTLAVRGLLPLALVTQFTSGQGFMDTDPLTLPIVQWLCEPAETIAFYLGGGTAASDLIAMLVGRAG